ncbi:MAG: hypothetical protein KDJ45_01540, partial [Hyphomicrobiaceae bacterium]|nr:hypothetical protein [Hyphomicrobiaceae bacterium]
TNATDTNALLKTWRRNTWPWFGITGDTHPDFENRTARKNAETVHPVPSATTAPLTCKRFKLRRWRLAFVFRERGRINRDIWATLGLNIVSRVEFCLTPDEYREWGLKYCP